MSTQAERALEDARGEYLFQQDRELTEAYADAQTIELEIPATTFMDGGYIVRTADWEQILAVLTDEQKDQLEGVFAWPFSVTK